MPGPVNSGEAKLNKRAPVTNDAKDNMILVFIFGFKLAGIRNVSKMIVTTGHKLLKTVRSDKEHLKETRWLTSWYMVNNTATKHHLK
mmetsp:Transcript_24715/g.43223  ORF Transcript_24715/g.43223 Transcript_24715/m.43223 type:complete len:87 (+) Transcript_24715:584-844(+)